MQQEEQTTHTQIADGCSHEQCGFSGVSPTRCAGLGKHYWVTAIMAGISGATDSGPSPRVAPGTLIKAKLSIGGLRLFGELPDQLEHALPVQ